MGTTTWTYVGTLYGTSNKDKTTHKRYMPVKSDA